MLLGVPPILPPELLMVLCQMGHGDELTIADANFPGDTLGKRVIRMDGHGVPEILDAILRLIPLDSYVDHPVALMQVTPGDAVQTPIWDTYKQIVAKYNPKGAALVENVERFAFYDRVQQKSVVVIMSGERAVYANIILKKGVIAPDA